MAKFKKGDRVKLLHLKKHKDESSNWAKKDGLKVGGIYEVTDLSCYEEWVMLYKGVFYHHPSKFKLIREPKTATIEIYKSRGQFKFRVKGANSKTLNHLYNSKQGCKKGIEALAKAMSNYKIIDLTK